MGKVLYFEDLFKLNIPKALKTVNKSLLYKTKAMMWFAICVWNKLNNWTIGRYIAIANPTHCTVYWKLKIFVYIFWQSEHWSTSNWTRWNITAFHPHFILICNYKLEWQRPSEVSIRARDLTGTVAGSSVWRGSGPEAGELQQAAVMQRHGDMVENSQGEDR